MEKFRSLTADHMDWDKFTDLMKKFTKDIDSTVNRKSKAYKARYKLYIALGCFWGLRAGDQLKLTWKDILDKDVIEIFEGKTSRTRKRKRIRKITVSKDVKEFISSMHNIIKPSRKAEPILPNKDGFPVSIQFLNRNLKKIFDGYGIKVGQLSTHSLRKTFGRAAWERGGKSEEMLVALSQTFNHYDTMVTRRYIGLTQEYISNIYLNVGTLEV